MIGEVVAFHPSRGLVGSVVKMADAFYVRTRFGNIKVDPAVGTALALHETRVVALAKAIRRSAFVALAAFLFGVIGGVFFS